MRRLKTQNTKQQRPLLEEANNKDMDYENERR